MQGSVDEDAFNRAPEIGPAPDMIGDDLPTNLDYLDESFGAAAGLRELREDDLNEFEVEDSAETAPVYHGSQIGVISNVGGETIKMLRPGGIHIVENYFDMLPAESTAGTTECVFLPGQFASHLIYLFGQSW
jgi:autophagy-related protein 2